MLSLFLVLATTNWLSNFRELSSIIANLDLTCRKEKANLSYASDATHSGRKFFRQKICYTRE